MTTALRLPTTAPMRALFRWLALISLATALSDLAIPLHLPGITERLHTDAAGISLALGNGPLGLALGAILTAVIGGRVDLRKLLYVSGRIAFASLLLLTATIALGAHVLAFALAFFAMSAALGMQESTHATIATANLGGPGLMWLNAVRLGSGAAVSLLTAPLIGRLPTTAFLAAYGLIALILVIIANAGISPDVATIAPAPKQGPPMSFGWLCLLMMMTSGAAATWGISYTFTTSALPSDLAPWQGAVALACLPIAAVIGYTLGAKLHPVKIAKLAGSGTIIGVTLIILAAINPAHALPYTMAGNIALGASLSPLLVIAATEITHRPWPRLAPGRVLGISTGVMYTYQWVSTILTGQLTRLGVTLTDARTIFCVIAAAILLVGLAPWVLTRTPETD